jgi:hypothetical protein
MLKYAHTHGCSWDKEICLKIAIYKNKFSIIEYIQNLKDENEVFNNEAISLTCNICKVNKKCVVYQPCGHLLSCWSCAVKNENCFNCNKKISSLLKIFFP